MALDGYWQEIPRPAPLGGTRLTRISATDGYRSVLSILMAPNLRSASRRNLPRFFSGSLVWPPSLGFVSDCRIGQRKLNYGYLRYSRKLPTQYSGEPNVDS